MTNQFHCSLPSEQFQGRKALIRRDLVPHILHTEEILDGYRYRIAGSDEALEKVADFIRAEHDCCSFLSFVLFVGSGSSPHVLEISGPPGVRKFIEGELGLHPAPTRGNR